MSVLAPSTTLALLAALAQRAESPSTTPYVSLSELSRADVVLEEEAGVPEAIATRRPRPTTWRPLRPALEPRRGKVAELVLTTRDGKLAFAVLSIGNILGTNERIVLVPAESLRAVAIDERPGYEVLLSRDELDRLPPFDLKKAALVGFDRASGPDRTQRAARAGRSSIADAVPEHVFFGKLKGCEVAATDGEVGVVQDAAIDPATGEVDYLLVTPGAIASAGSLPYLFPLAACRWTRLEGRDVLKISSNAGDVRSAPTYMKPEQGFLTPEQIRSANASFSGPGRQGPSLQ